MLMVKRKNKFLFVALYVLLLCSFLFLIFNHYSFEDLKTFEFIKHTKYWLSSYTENSIWYREIFASSIIFILFGLIWVFFLGFGSPLAIFAGMYFGLIYGTIITIITLTIGSTALYLAAKYFASDIIEKIFFKKYKNNKLIQRFHNNELKFFIVYRFIAEIPFGLANLIAIFFNMKTKNFILGTLIGLFPSIFIFVSIGNGLNTVMIKKDNFPSIFEMLTSREIYVPLLIFVIFCTVIYYFKSYIFAEKKI